MVILYRVAYNELSSPLNEVKNLEWNPTLLRGMHTYPDQVISSNSMRSTLRHGDIECDVECLITSSRPHLKVLKHP